MFICLECGNIFIEPKLYIETHGLDSPPYENFYGCPKCGGSFNDVPRCDICGQYIEDEYITTNKGDIICDSCYIVHSIYD